MNFALEKSEDHGIESILPHHVPCQTARVNGHIAFRVPDCQLVVVVQARLREHDDTQCSSPQQYSLRQTTKLKHVYDEHRQIPIRTRENKSTGIQTPPKPVQNSYTTNTHILFAYKYIPRKRTHGTPQSKQMHANMRAQTHTYNTKGGNVAHRHAFACAHTYTTRTTHNVGK